MTAVSRRVPRWSFVPPPRTLTVRPESAHARRSSAQPSGESGRSVRGIERELLAPAWRGEDLPGARDTERVERVLDPPHDGHVDGRVLQPHVAVLLHAHAVLAGDGAADREAGLEDLAARLFHPLDLRRPLRAVEHDQRPQVAVAGVEAAGDAPAVAPPA